MHQIDEDADVVVVSRIFNGAAIENTIPPYHLIVAEEEEKINPKTNKNLHRETLTLKTRPSGKKLLKR